MSHNFTHSFVSLMNYVNGGYVIDDLKNMARKAKGETIAIDWLSEEGDYLPFFTDRVIESISNSKEYLPKHMAKHQVSIEMVSEMRTDIYIKNNKILVNAYLKDIHGKEYLNNVEY